MKHSLFLLLISIFAVGCAEPGMESDLQNSPAGNELRAPQGGIVLKQQAPLITQARILISTVTQSVFLDLQFIDRTNSENSFPVAFSYSKKCPDRALGGFLGFETAYDGFSSAGQNQTVKLKDDFALLGGTYEGNFFASMGYQSFIDENCKITLKLMASSCGDGGGEGPACVELLGEAYAAPEVVLPRVYVD